MKIILTRKTGTDWLDGANTFIFELSSALIKMNHEVTVVTYFSQFSRDEVRRKFFVEEVPQIINIGQRPYRETSHDLLEWLFGWFRIYLERRPDYVIMSDVVPILKVPKTILVNHSLVNIKRYPIFGASLLYRYLPHSIVCPSHKQKKEVAEVLRVPPTRITVIPLGLNTKKFVPSKLDNRGNTILHVGTADVKNLQTTVKAFNLVSRRLPDTKLLIAGAGNSSVDRALRLIAKDAKHNVYNLGLVSRERLQELYSSAKVFIMPSYYESFSYVTLEALASGTPVVCSPVIPEELVSDGLNGFVVRDPNDYEDFAQKLLAILTQEELWTYLSRNAVKRANDLDVSKIASQYLELLTKTGK